MLIANESHKYHPDGKFVKFASDQEQILPTWIALQWPWIREIREIRVLKNHLDNCYIISKNYDNDIAVDLRVL